MTLIENPYYESTASIVSLYCAREHLEIEFTEKQNRQIPWEDIPLLYAKDYTLGTQELCPDDVIEICTLEELAGIDTGYAGLVK